MLICANTLGTEDTAGHDLQFDGPEHSKYVLFSLSSYPPPDLGQGGTLATGPRVFPGAWLVLSALRPHDTCDGDSIIHIFLLGESSTGRLRNLPKSLGKTSEYRHSSYLYFKYVLEFFSKNRI
uniref:Uncharacterized protein n=1 Tax=Molossus molossus TaxID=27622 RepID=A0A7J8DQE3_MOLMO|nr:hypothetical protein HJG59_009303 [Molossus molossus]